MFRPLCDWEVKEEEFWLQRAQVAPARLEARFLERARKNSVLRSSGYSRLPKELNAENDRWSSTWVPTTALSAVAAKGAGRDASSARKDESRDG